VWSVSFTRENNTRVCLGDKTGDVLHSGCYCLAVRCFPSILIFSLLFYVALLVRTNFCGRNDGRWLLLAEKTCVCGVWPRICGKKQDNVIIQIGDHVWCAETLHREIVANMKVFMVCRSTGPPMLRIRVTLICLFTEGVSEWRIFQ
jgi:hypothetical protein